MRSPTWGRLLGQQFHEIDRDTGPLSWIVIAAAVIIYLYRVVRIRRTHQSGWAGDVEGSQWILDGEE